MHDIDRDATNTGAPSSSLTSRSCALARLHHSRSASLVAIALELGSDHLARADGSAGVAVPVSYSRDADVHAWPYDVAAPAIESEDEASDTETGPIASGRSVSNLSEDDCAAPPSALCLRSAGRVKHKKFNNVYGTSSTRGPWSAVVSFVPERYFGSSKIPYAVGPPCSCDKMAARIADRLLIAARGPHVKLNYLNFQLSGYAKEPFYRQMFGGQIGKPPPVGVYDADLVSGDAAAALRLQEYLLKAGAFERDVDDNGAASTSQPEPPSANYKRAGYRPTTVKVSSADGRTEADYHADAGGSSRRTRRKLIGDDSDADGEEQRGEAQGARARGQDKSEEKDATAVGLGLGPRGVLVARGAKHNKFRHVYSHAGRTDLDSGALARGRWSTIVAFGPQRFTGDWGQPPFVVGPPCCSVQAAARNADRILIAARHISHNFPLKGYVEEPFYQQLFGGDETSRPPVGVHDPAFATGDAAAASRLEEFLLTAGALERDDIDQASNEGSSEQPRPASASASASKECKFMRVVPAWSGGGEVRRTAACVLIGGRRKHRSSVQIFGPPCWSPALSARNADRIYICVRGLELSNRSINGQLNFPLSTYEGEAFFQTLFRSPDPPPVGVYDPMLGEVRPGRALGEVEEAARRLRAFLESQGAFEQDDRDCE